ncbi:sigma-54 interaction domain-containing protein [Dethiothermospora halolimnae]|uniref:sigma-54 interaction domain-containing protein n=1 Tax=Dethiothermospora halolimnae TaxID=3114390 RepID=UPI003CCC2C4C
MLSKINVIEMYINICYSFNEDYYLPYERNEESLENLSVSRDIKVEKLCRDCSKAMWDELQDMRRISKKLDAVIESSYDGIYITDGEAKTLKVNKSYERITGFSRENFIGKTMYELVQDKYISKSCTLLVLKNKKTTTIQQELSTGKTILATGTPVFDEDGKIELVVTNVRDVTELIELRAEVERSKKIADKYYLELKEMRKQIIDNECLIVKDHKSREIIEKVNRVSKYDTTVLIKGEPGTGKKIMAKYIHKKSGRNEKPFIKVNCGAIPESLMEAELFGCEAGNCIGDDKNDKIGAFQLAEGGTIFLEEIEILPNSIQAKLLRTLQEQQIQRVGASKLIDINVRIIVSTDRNLEDMVANGGFREDLFYILNVVPIELLPLRNRKEDIIPLAEHFLEKLNKKYGTRKGFSKEVYRTLYSYKWSGNVRELKNMVERVYVMANDGVILESDLPDYINSVDMKLDVNDDIMDLKKATGLLEEKLIKKAFDKYGNVRDASKALGISPSTFVRKRMRYEK